MRLHNPIKAGSADIGDLTPNPGVHHRMPADHALQWGGIACFTIAACGNGISKTDNNIRMRCFDHDQCGKNRQAHHHMFFHATHDCDVVRGKKKRILKLGLYSLLVRINSILRSSTKSGSCSSSSILRFCCNFFWSSCASGCSSAHLSPNQREVSKT